jgi:hypothetical protein
VVVPTYWTRAGGALESGDAMYDHPTPVDDEGTLGRLLESLTLLDVRQFYVVIVVAVTALSVAAEASARVRATAQRYPSLSTLVVDDSVLTQLEAAVTIPNVTDLIALTDYSRVRNLQLLAPLALRCRAIVAVDDDEVVIDPKFLFRAIESLGSVIDGRVVAGLAGYYLQNRKGQILLDVAAASSMAPNIFDRKAVIMNDATNRVQAKRGKIVPTPFCFGGNMIFTPDLAARVCFDPAITRGEDIDYLINARLIGHWFYMNKKLTILHEPPAGGSYHDSAFHKTVQDLLRFVYEREKLKAWRQIGASEPVTAEDLDPYPGIFLRPDLDGFVGEVFQRILDQTDEGHRLTLGIPETVPEFMDAAQDHARAGVGAYRRRQTTWALLVREAEEGSHIRTLLSNELDVGAA